MLKSDFADTVGQQMMTRLWPASLALAIFLCAGQALATDNSCKYSGVTISSVGTISVTCDSTKSYTALLHGTSSASCTYLGSNNTPAISINGSSGAIEAWCAGASTSTGASFTVSAANSATVGTPLSFTVIRTASNGTPVDDTLTLAAVSGSTATALFNPTSVSFGASEPASASRTPRVIFTSAGTATLTLTPRSSGDTITSSTLITVSGTSTSVDTCSGIPVPPYATDGGSATASTSTSLGIHRLIAASASERAAGAIRFTAPSSGSLTFNVDSIGLAATDILSSLDMTVSACPGDFSPTSSACKIPGTISKGVKITVGATDCPVTANLPYYVNVRSVTPGRDVGLHLSTTP